MATLKGKGDFYTCWEPVHIDFVIELACDDTDALIPSMLKQIPKLIATFAEQRQYGFSDVLENQALIKKHLMNCRVGLLFCSVPFREMAKDITLVFSTVPEPADVEQPKPQVIVKEVINYVDVPKEVIVYVEKPQPKLRKKTLADKIKDRIGEKADRLVSVSGVTKELLKRYAPEMEEDSDLRDALTRLLEALGGHLKTGH